MKITLSVFVGVIALLFPFLNACTPTKTIDCAEYAIQPIGGDDSTLIIRAWDTVVIDLGLPNHVDIEWSTRNGGFYDSKLTIGPMTPSWIGGALVKSDYLNCKSERYFNIQQEVIPEDCGLRAGEFYVVTEEDSIYHFQVGLTGESKPWYDVYEVTFHTDGYLLLLLPQYSHENRLKTSQETPNSAAILPEVYMMYQERYRAEQRWIPSLSNEKSVYLTKGEVRNTSTLNFCKVKLEEEKSGQVIYVYGWLTLRYT